LIGQVIANRNRIHHIGRGKRNAILMGLIGSATKAILLHATSAVATISCAVTGRHGTKTRIKLVLGSIFASIFGSTRNRGRSGRKLKVLWVLSVSWILSVFIANARDKLEGVGFITHQPPVRSAAATSTRIGPASLVGVRVFCLDQCIVVKRDTWKGLF
jgi:hypothetical protein